MFTFRHTGFTKNRYKDSQDIPKGLGDHIARSYTPWDWDPAFGCP